MKQDTEIKVDKKIPIPDKWSRRSGRPNKYPTKTLEVGESFFIPEETGSRQNAFSIAYHASIRMKPKKFICRAVEGGWRIWRIK